LFIYCIKNKYSKKHTYFTGIKKRLKYMNHTLITITVLISFLITSFSYSQGFSFVNTVTSSSSGYQASIRAVKVDQLGNKYNINFRLITWI